MLQERTGWALSALALMLSPSLAVAQTAVDGAIGGSVTDTTGAAVPNAQVVIHDNGTNAEQTLTADGSGFYRAVHLQPGAYNVRVTAPGFSEFRSVNAIVQVGVFTTINAALTVGEASQVVTVNDQAPLVNTVSPDFAGVVSQLTIHDLPENNYRWSAFALLTPGVTFDTGGFGLLSFRGQSTLLNNVTIDGTDDNQAYFSEERGRTRAGYSTIKESVQEFQVNTSNYSVEYGRSAGGIVNSVTKSGSNAFHGQGYYFDRDSAWNAENPTVTHPVPNGAGGYTTQIFKPTDLRRQFGFTAGGPFIKDKLFFFVAGDKFFHDFPAAATITSNSGNANFYTPADAALPAGKTCGVATGTSAPNYQDANVCTVASATGLSYAQAFTQYTNGINGLASLLGTVPRTGDQTIWFPKLDWQVNAKNHASVEANRLRWTSPAGIQTNPAVAYGMESFGNDYVRDNWIVGKLDTLFTAKLANEVRYMYGRDFEFEDNQTPTAYEENNLVHNSAGYVNPLGLPTNVYLSGFFQFGTAQFLQRAAYPDERRWQLADSLDYQWGNHDLKIGEDYVHTYDLLNNLYNQFGGYTYAGNQTLGDYAADLYLASQGRLAQNYEYYNQGTGSPGLQFTTGDYAAFVQDQWKVSRRLSLVYGLRWEYESFPSTQIANPLFPGTSNMPDNKANIGPRVGFAWDVTGGGNTILRGGYGEFFARAINSTIYNALITTGTAAAQSNPNLYPGGATAPSFPQVIAPANQARVLGAGSGNAAIDYFSPNFNVPEIHQADLTLEHQLGPQDSFSISWLGTLGRRLPDFVDVNLPAPTAVTFEITGAQVPGGLKPGTLIRANAFLGGTAARPNKNFSTITDIFSGVTSNYTAAVWTYQHRFSHFASLNANYTWSRAMDYGVNSQTGTATTSLLDPTNIRQEYGRSPENTPSRMVIYAIVDAPWHVHGPVGYLVNDFEFAPDFQAQTGLPYSLGISGSASLTTNGTNTNTLVNTSSFNGSGGADRVPFVDRDNYQQPRINLLDARVSKRIVVRERYRVEVLGEAFNLLNHQNVSSVSATAYTVSVAPLAAGGAKVNQLIPYTSTPFGTVTGVNNSNFAYSQRQVQLGARIQF